MSLFPQEANVNLMSYLTLVNCISDVMVSVLASSAVDHGFIVDVMVSVLASSAVDHGFIGDVMVSVLASSAVDYGFIGDVMLVCSPRVR